ncbi:MAG: PAS domain S-box protein, partial [Hyphomicrobiales bacterium]
MASVWQALVGNFAVVIVFIFAWCEAQLWLDSRSRRIRRIAFALWFGAGAIATMLLAVPIAPGVYIDLRITMVSLAGFFGGPIAALFVAALASAIRVTMGGQGLFAGLMMIATATIGGLAARQSFRSARPPEHAMVLLGLSAALAGLVALAFIPLSNWPFAIAGSLVPMAMINGSASVAAAYAILRADRSRQEQHLLRAAIAQAPDYLYVKDLDSRFVAANAAVAAYNQFSDPKQMIGKTDRDLTGDDRARELFHAEQDMMHGKLELIDIEEEVTGPGGQKHWFVTSKQPIRDAAGATVGLVGVTRDVTRYRQLESELRGSRDLLSQALADMSDGVAMFDAAGRLTFSNDRYRTSFPLTGHVRQPGVPLEEILREVVRTGEQVGEPLRDSTAWMKAVLSSLKSGGEEQVQLFDGRWLHIRTRAASVSWLRISAIASDRAPCSGLTIPNTRISAARIAPSVPTSTRSRGLRPLHHSWNRSTAASMVGERSIFMPSPSREWLHPPQPQSAP